MSSSRARKTYADISPMRLGSNGVTAFISIMRGCDNMCSFCVVPFTRGRERSRDAFSIVAEATDLYEKGYREVTLLGQNVDSYKWEHPENGEVVNFCTAACKMTANVHPDLRIRFSTSHPKDITDDVLYAMRDNENVCKLHPLTRFNRAIVRVLKLMKPHLRPPLVSGEKCAAFMKLCLTAQLARILSAGFCTETEEETSRKRRND